MACTVEVHFMNISEAFYDYATTYQLQRWYGGDGLSEQVQVSTNVENGLGVFCRLQFVCVRITSRRVIIGGMATDWSGRSAIE